MTFNKEVIVKFGDEAQALAIVTDANATLADGQIRYSNTGFELYFDMTKHQSDVSDIITITYSAVVNENAVVTTGGNSNKATLEYSNNPNDSTKTNKENVEEIVYIIDLTIDKYAGRVTDDDGNAVKTTKLSGTKFVLVKKVIGDDGNTVESFYKYTAKDSSTNTAAKVEWVSDSNDATVVTTDANGAAKFNGLEAGTYYLRETEAPAGYNLLTEDVTVNITRSTDATTGDVTISGNTAEVANLSGTELPSTGGIGTTIFYVIGAILVIGAVVLLITKKRMSGTKE